MLNRILLRIKIVQLLYAYRNNSSQSLHAVEKELLHSFQQTCHLYNYLLLLVSEITFFAHKRQEAAKNKFNATDAERNPNVRFTENLFAAQLAKNEMLNNCLKEYKLSWADHQPLVKSIYENITGSDFYQEYMNMSEETYAREPYVYDRELWRNIFKNSVVSDELLNTLEEENIYWNDDLETVLSFVLKTIKRFEAENGAKQPLMPMFKDDEDREFAVKLFHEAIVNGDEYQGYIKEQTHNWEGDRIALMDMVIMELAIAEMLSFPNIPLRVTLNEYIEIAKAYSTDRSSIFINGVLDKIANQLKKENKLIKAKIVSVD